MLAPDSKADKPRRDSPKQRYAFEQAQDERHFIEHCLADNERC